MKYENAGQTGEERGKKVTYFGGRTPLTSSFPWPGPASDWTSGSSAISGELPIRWRSACVQTTIPIIECGNGPFILTAQYASFFFLAMKNKYPVISF